MLESGALSHRNRYGNTYRTRFIIHLVSYTNLRAIFSSKVDTVQRPMNKGDTFDVDLC